MIVYLDTSALVKLVVAEPGTEETLAILNDAPVVATSDVSYVEARAALARMRVGRRIDASSAQAARRTLDDVWLDLLSVPPDDELLARAADLADEHSLRGYDSLQLASALSLRSADEVEFACWDTELKTAAANAGLALA